MERLAQSPVERSFVQDPYPFYERARALGPIFYWEDYGVPAAVSHSAVNVILRDRRFGREPPPGRTPPVPEHLIPFQAIEDHSMLELDPPRHTRLRGLVLRGFTARRIAELEPGIAALAHRLIDDLPREGPFDLLRGFAEPLPAIVIARLIGLPDEVAPQLLAWSHAMVAMYQARRDPAVERAAGRAAAEFAEFLRAEISRRRRRPGTGLIDALIAAADDDGARLSPDEMVATLILLLNAGHEATVHTLGNGVHALLKARVPATALAPDRIEATVEEVLRFDPPLHLFLRWVREPVDVMGTRFEPGDRVACLLAAANRDPGVWDRPARFDPGRPLRPHNSFGAGIHFCLGAPLARSELRIALAVLFAHCPGLRLVGRPRYADLYHFRGLERLTVAR
ncbi:MAG: cytochrome P450 [Gemmobacter sp.]